MLVPDGGRRGSKRYGDVLELMPLSFVFSFPLLVELGLHDGPLQAELVLVVFSSVSLLL